MSHFGTTISPNALRQNTLLIEKWHQILLKEKEAQKEQENIAAMLKQQASAAEKLRQIQENNSRLQEAYLKGF
jgi:hypothetical protein